MLLLIMVKILAVLNGSKAKSEIDIVIVLLT